MPATISEKLLFYTELRKDPLVKDLNAEQRIRGLVDDLLLYVNQANAAEFAYVGKGKRVEKLVNFVEYMRKKKEHQDDPEAQEQLMRDLQDRNSQITVKCNSLSPDFLDIRSIAYCIGTFHDDRNLIQKLLTTVDPLEKKLLKCQANYLVVQNTGVLESRSFDVDLDPELDVLADGKAEGVQRQQAFAGLQKKCGSYLTRARDLSALMLQQGKIIHFYPDDDRLSKKRLKELAKLYYMQSQIDLTLFQTLHHTAMRMSGVQEPKFEVDIHFMYDYFGKMQRSEALKLKPDSEYGGAGKIFFRLSR